MVEDWVRSGEIFFFLAGMPRRQSGQNFEQKVTEETEGVMDRNLDKLCRRPTIGTSGALPPQSTFVKGMAVAPPRRGFEMKMLGVRRFILRFFGRS